MSEKTLTGYPSIDKPWLKYYSEESLKAASPECSVTCRIYEHNKEHLDDTAFIFYGKKITYRKMFLEIDRAAVAFAKSGIKKDDKVILFTSSTPEVIEAILALGKLGAVANMINPLFTQEQIVGRINESGASALIVMEQLWDKLEGVIDKLCVEKIIVVSVLDSMPTYIRCLVGCKLKANIKYSRNIIRWNDFIEQNQDTSIVVKDNYEKGQPFVMVYSSGTTGASKGIVLTHDGINATISHYISPDFPYKREDRFLQMVPIWFSTGIVITCLMPLCLGVTVVLEPVFSAKTFCQDVRKYKPSMTLVSTSLWLALCNDKKSRNADLSLMKYPITGGEALLPRAEDYINNFLRKRNCEVGILQGYGMCELGSTVTSNTNNHKRKGSAGIPITGVTVAAFDLDTNEEMQYNQRGELRVMSPARMKYYYKNEAATREYFYVDAKGNTWGCTGDIGYLDEDGYVYVLGRATDCFTASTGRKIYNFDIENMAYMSENVARCKAVALPTKQGYEIAVLHVVKEDNYKGTDAQLIKELQELSNKYLEKDSIPSGYKICGRLPVKASGKLDMEKLKQDRNGFSVVEDNELKCIDFSF